jgi:hypothetical protein
MRRLSRFKRSTAASKAWMPKLRSQCRCQAPQPRIGAPKAQGLIAALRPQHNPPCRRHIAVLQLPFVVLLEQHCADQPDDRGLVGEDADDVGAAFDFLVEPLNRVGAVQFAAVRLGKVEIGQHFGLAVVDECGELRPFLAELVGQMPQHRAGLGPVRLQEGLASAAATMLCWVFGT